MAKEKIVVDEVRNPVTVMTEEASVRPLGTMISRIYEGEKVQRHEFESAERSYRLGPTTTAFKFVDHTAVMKPMFDAGFFPQDVILSRGGLNLFSVWVHRDAKKLRDLVTWDRGIWPRSREKGIFEAVILSSAIRPGKGISYRHGLFRLICTNGLFNELLGLGSLKMNHATFNVDRLASELFGQPTVVTKGPYVGVGHAVEAVKTIVDTLQEDEDYEPDLPIFVRDQTKAFANLPNWYIGELQEQLELLSQAEKVHAIDILTATSNAINMGRLKKPDRSVNKPLARQHSLNDSLVNLVGALSL